MKTRIWIIFGLFSIVFTACDRPTPNLTLPTSPPGPNQTWIDAPLPNSTLPLLPYKLIFHGASFVGVTEFEININGIAEAAVLPISTGSGGSKYGTLFTGEYEWNPPAPGIYLIQVRAKGNGIYSSPDQVQVTVTGDVVESATQTPQVVEIEQCTYKAIINHFCRRGPSKYFEAIDNFIPEQVAPIIGQSTDGFFWYVIGPNYGEVCTVPNEDRFGEVSGDCEMLPRFTPIPSPTPTEEIMGCTIRQAGGAIICESPCPVGAAPGNPCTP
jgi:hypothetical protein